MIASSAHLVERRAEPDEFAAFATRLCQGEPRLEGTPHGEARVCLPRPSVAIEGQTFMLEVASAGVVGLLAIHVANGASSHLVRELMDHGTSWCTGSWRPVSPRADNAHEELHVCPLSAGALLAVGRFPQDLRANVWQVSLAVMAPG